MEDIQNLFLDFGEGLINLFKSTSIDFKEYGFNSVDVEASTHGHIFNGDMNIGYIIVKDDEMLYTYNDSEGMICFNSKYFDKNFIIVFGETYHGYECLKKEPYDFLQKVTNKISECFKEKKHSKRFHI